MIWEIQEYKRKDEILHHGEKLWQPYGTTGKLEKELPNYIKRLLNIKEEIPSSNFERIEPDFLKNIISSIEALKKDSQHQERAHESLVEDFLVALNYKKHIDIKYRQSRIDLTVYNDEKPLLLIEAKRDWNLNWETSANALKQAYGYSYGKGIRYILLTNGDYYSIFDRIKGLSYQSNLIGEFQLSNLNNEDIALIEKIKKDNLIKIDVGEIFRNLSEAFE